jgi:uncharacterized membrane protein
MTVSSATRDDVARSQRFTDAGPALEYQPGQRRQPHGFRNVGPRERLAALGSGAVLALLGLRRRDTAGYVIAGIGGALLYRGASGNCPMYSALGIDHAHPDAQTERSRAQQRLNRRGVQVTQTFTIGRPRAELYQFWRDFSNLPRIMSHLEEVRVLDGSDGRRSHWVAKAPAAAMYKGGRVEWDAELTADEPDRLIAWRSLPGGDIDTAGSVAFEDSPRGTIVRCEMRYVTPAGRLGGLIAKLFGESPEREIREGLRQFKRVMEIGEPLTILGQSHGTCTGQGAPYSEKNAYMPRPSV